MPQISKPDVAEQVRQAGIGMVGGISVLGKELERQAIASGDITIDTLTDPAELNFGRFGRKTTFNHGCRIDLRLGAATEDGGLDEVVVGVKKPDGSTQVVEIGRNSRNQQRQGPAPYGNPESDFILIIHEGDAVNSCFVGPSDINKFARPGEPFVFGSEKSLGQVFEWGSIEKVVGFSEPVQPAGP